MFVGDVRCATTAWGSSWKLSGGSEVIRGPHELLEVAPGPPAQAPVGLGVGRRQLAPRRGRRRHADPAGDGRRDQPEHETAQRPGMAEGCRTHDQEPGDGRDQDAGRHAR